MKKSTPLFMHLAVILISSLLVSCQKEGNEPNAADSEVSFAINISHPNKTAMLKSPMAYNLSDADRIVLTIQFCDGSSTKYTHSKVKIEQMNGNFYTQKIVLKTGCYKLTEFLILNAADSTIFAAPLIGSQEAQNVSNPLPIEFSVTKNITSSVSVEVLSTQGKKPEDFGLNTFPIIEVKTFGFMIGVADNESGKLLTAKLTVSNGSYSYVQNLDSILNNVVTVKDSLTNYILTVEKSGYKTYAHTYPIDSIKVFKNTDGNLPLLVELEKENGLTVTDIDGNVYHTVKIGTQVWMAENLKTTKYNDGTSIPLVENGWPRYTPAYCWYNNDVNTYKVYGALYNWYVIDPANSKKVCPTGWHVPSIDEWTTLTNFLGGNIVAGGKMKEAGTIHWLSPNTGATNESGFTALPGGSRSYYNEVFERMGVWCGLWSTTAESYSYAWGRELIYNSTNGKIGAGRFDKTAGVSIRCVQD